MIQRSENLQKIVDALKDGAEDADIMRQLRWFYKAHTIAEYLDIAHDIIDEGIEKPELEDSTTFYRQKPAKASAKEKARRIVKAETEPEDDLTEAVKKKHPEQFAEASTTGGDSSGGM